MRTKLPLLALASLLLQAPTAGAEDPATTLQGQVVCSGCWDEADRRTTPYGTEADLKCAARCAKNGVGSSLSVKKGDDFELYVLEPGGFKPKANGWSSYAGKRVEARGTVRTEKDRKVLKVDELKVLAANDGSSARR